MLFFFGALPIDQLKIKNTKKLKEIPSRHFLENHLEESKHSCLYTSETHWQFTGILPIYNGRHAKGSCHLRFGGFCPLRGWGGTPQFR